MGLPARITEAPKLRDKLNPELMALFGPYFSKTHQLDLPALVDYDPDLFELVKKFHPEVLDLDWPNISSKEVRDTWELAIRRIGASKFDLAQEFFEWPTPYREICRLPKREFAKIVLENDGMGIKGIFDFELMEVWAGYRKPEVKIVGNVHYLGKQ